VKVILLAAGFGTRLRPLTNDVPKCLVPVNGRPLLDHWLENLLAHGFGPFLINTHYLSDQVEYYLRHSPYSNRASLVYEPELLGTAGTLIGNIRFFSNESGLLVHADNYCSADFSAFKKAHESRPSGCVMTMMTFRTNTPSSCGIVELDENGIVVGFHEKVDSPPGNLANGAIYALSGEFLNMLTRDYAGASDFSTEILPEFIGKIYTYETRKPLVDIGTPEAYRHANQLACSS